MGTWLGSPLQGCCSGLNSIPPIPVHLESHKMILFGNRSLQMELVKIRS